MLSSCVASQTFNFEEYSGECRRLNVKNWVWKPPGSSDIRIDRYWPENVTEEIFILAEWADRTDPDQVIRTQNAHRLWFLRAKDDLVINIS
jgi:hypothetical protein